MIDENKVKVAVEEFTKNPYWKEELETAPSELSKRYTELGFCFSWYFGKIPTAERDEILAERDNLKHQFGLEDWKHTLKYCGHNPFHAVCVEKIKELEAAQEKS